MIFDGVWTKSRANHVPAALKVAKSSFDLSTSDNQILGEMRGGNYPAVRNDAVINIKIPIPPLEIQKKMRDITGKKENLTQNIKNAVFVGSTKDLIRSIKDESL